MVVGCHGSWISRIEPGFATCKICAATFVLSLELLISIFKSRLRISKVRSYDHGHGTAKRSKTITLKQ